MNETVENFRSSALGNERPIWVREPNYPAAARNLTVFLDGEIYRSQVRANPVIDALQGAIADSWYIFVSMQSVEARWLECPCHPPFADFIARELMPWLETRFAMRAVQQRTLIGLSYTGLAAVFVAKQFPGLFTRVISQSGSFWWNDCYIVRQYETVRGSPTAFYLNVGTRETQENVQHRADVRQVASQIEGVRRFRDVLQANGHTVEYIEFEGGHHPAGWNAALPDALKWALPQPSNDPESSEERI